MTSTTIPPEDDEDPIARALRIARMNAPLIKLVPERRLTTAVLDVAIAELQSRRSQPDSDREAIIEECAKAVEGYRQCPFDKGAPPNDLEPHDPCPVCGDLGTFDLDKPSNCGNAAAIIRSLKHSDTTSKRSEDAPTPTGDS